MTQRLRILLAALVLCAVSAVARADVDVTITVGHGNRWISGASTPVIVSLKNSGTSPVAVRLELAEGGLVERGDLRYERAVLVGAQTTRREVFLVPGPQASNTELALDVATDPRTPIHASGKSYTRGRATLQLQARSATIYEFLPIEARTVGVMFDETSVIVNGLPGANSSGFAGMTGDVGMAAGVAVAPESLAAAPFSLDGLDSLVVVDPAPSFCADPSHLEALLDWVALGGMLVITPGRDTGSLGASALGPYLPATAGKSETMPYSEVLRVLEEFADEKVEKQARGRPGPWVPLSPLAGAEPPPRQHLGDDPPFVDRRLGRGRIRMLAFDPRIALSCAHPEDTADFGAVATVLSGRRQPLHEKRDRDRYAQLGYQVSIDVDESIARVLRHGAFEAPPLLLVLLGLGLYVLVVGPLDFLILKRLKKQRLTTFTFAGAVLLFTAIAYGTSFLLFAGGSVVNRVVFADLVDAGRDGRELLYMQDIAGFYAPRGVDRTLEFPLPATILESSLPGGRGMGEFGRALPVVASGTDPLRPEARVQVAYRSQRVVRSVLAGATGRTIDVTWEGGRPRITNGLHMALEPVILLTPKGETFAIRSLASGDSVLADMPVTGSERWLIQGAQDLHNNSDRTTVNGFLGWLSRTAPPGIGTTRRRTPTVLDVARETALLKGGIAGGDGLVRERSLLLAFADEAPLPLPGEDDNGTTYVVIRKEIDEP